MPDIKDFGLGRKQATDHRDVLFSLKAMVEQKPVDRTSRYWNANAWWGNQGDTPQCVGYSWAHLITDGPVTHKGIVPLIDPSKIYTHAQMIDEWPGEDYEGTSVRAAAKYLQSIGVISEYRWAFDTDTLAQAVITTGPAVIGINWYESMFWPSSDKGIIQIGGQIAGGHAVKVDGVNTKTKFFRIKNNWGRKWGKSGFAYISFDDMKRLIEEQGEICMPVEVKVPTLTDKE